MTSSKDRHLMAVMFTDVVGYTALMQDDEDAARAVRARHRFVLEQRIADYGGELLQYLGDGSLSIFPSAVNAVAAAVEIQREARSDPTLPLRIGIHQGEINFDAQGAYGDSVNIAARIESLGVPGSVLISGKVHDDVKNQPAYATVSLGQFELKNVKRPVEVFALAMDGLAVPSGSEIEAARDRAVTKEIVPSAAGTDLVTVADRAALFPRRRVSWLSVAFAALAILFAAAWIREVVLSQPLPVARFDVTPPEGRALLPNVAGVDLAISPDGERIVYVGQASGGTQLWQRRISDLDPQPIPGTNDARDPVFSPDGQSIAFRVGATLRTVALAGGDPVIVIGQDLAGGADWGPDGLLYYPAGGTLFRVSPRGGDPEPVTPPTDGVHRFPQVLPGARSVLFTIEVPGSPERARIAVARPGADSVQEIGPGMMGRYTGSGHLLFGTANGTVRAAPFDLRRVRLEGPATTILTARDLRDGPTTKFAVSASGTLIYRTGLVEPIVMQFAWMTRSAGRATLIDADWTFNPGRDNRSWDISPDGSRLALKAATDLGSDIWVKTLPDGPIARFTFDPGEERMPRWAPDGQSLLFISPRNGNLDVWSRRADGVGDPVLVADLEQSIADVVWSPDGEWLILRTAGTAGVVGGRDLYVMRLGVDTVPRPLLAANADEAAPALSPDGRWLAYHSAETGRREVFVRPFPNVNAGHFQVSAGGGRSPVWSHAGDELFYISDGSGEVDSRRMMVATIDPDPTFQVLRRQVVFTIEDNYYFANNTTSYRVAADDERFLMARYVGESARVEMVLVQNFFDALREKIER